MKIAICGSLNFTDKIKTMQPIVLDGDLSEITKK